jgi:hypothetical protein
VLQRSKQAVHRRAATPESNRLYDELDRLAVSEARVLRLLRAYETLGKLAALRRRPGAAANYYDQLVACERAPL